MIADSPSKGHGSVGDFKRSFSLIFRLSGTGTGVGWHRQRMCWSTAAESAPSESSARGPIVIEPEKAGAGQTAGRTADAEGAFFHLSFLLAFGTRYNYCWHFPWQRSNTKMRMTNGKWKWVLRRLLPLPLFLKCLIIIIVTTARHRDSCVRYGRRGVRGRRGASGEMLSPDGGLMTDPVDVWIPGMRGSKLAALRDPAPTPPRNYSGQER